jgi:hypothetical protein
VPGEGDIGRDIAANLRVIFGLIGNQPQLRHKLQRPCGTGDGQIAGFRLGGQSALDGQIGDGALDAVGQRVIVETQSLEKGINARRRNSGGIRDAYPANVNATWMEKSKRDVKPSAFAISLRQNGSVFFSPSRGVNVGFGFFT